MKSILVQFHAEESEIAQFIDMAIKFSGATFIALKFNPFAIWNAHDVDFMKILNQGYWRFAFLLGPPPADVRSAKEFNENNAEALILDVGRVEKGVLSESCFSYRSPEGLAHKHWTTLIRKLKKGMIKGVRATNPHTGASCVVGGHYYTPGAKRKFESGVKWKTLGSNFLEPLS
jgi:hypothetical protein